MEADSSMIESQGVHHNGQQQQFQMNMGGVPQVQERQSIMTINRPNLMDSLKQKCLNRLTEHRRSAIQRKRQEQMHILTESKRKNGFIERQVANEIVQDNIMQGFIMEEINNLPELSIDDWNREYDQIYNELNEFLAKQLIESTTYDESYHYERYQLSTDQETEQIAQTYDPNNNGFYICAVCKRYIYRVRGSRVCCERPGCIDIDLGNENFKLEDLMNMVMSVVLEHRQGRENEGKECCPEEKHLKVKVAAINEVFKSDNEDEQMNGEQQLALFVTCDNCEFLDFVSLY